MAFWVKKINLRGRRLHKEEYPMATKKKATKKAAKKKKR
jgi:hypothetical protein